MTLELVFTAFLLDALHYYEDSVENKPTSLLVMKLEKALSEIPPSCCDEQVAGGSYTSSLLRFDRFLVIVGSLSN